MHTQSILRDKNPTHDPNITLLALRRQIRGHYDTFKEGEMNEKEYLASIKALDKNIDNIEMSNAGFKI